LKSHSQLSKELVISEIAFSLSMTLGKSLSTVSSLDLEFSIVLVSFLSVSLRCFANLMTSFRLISPASNFSITILVSFEALKLKLLTAKLIFLIKLSISFFCVVLLFIYHFKSFKLTLKSLHA